MLDAVSPPLQQFVVVTADVEFRGADVNEIGGQIFSVRKFPGGIGEYKGDVMFAQ